MHPERPSNFFRVLPYFITYADFPLLTQSLSVIHLISIDPSPSTISVWCTYPHSPTPHTTQHITQLFPVQFLFHFFFCASGLNSDLSATLANRHVLCQAINSLHAPISQFVTFRHRSTPLCHIV